MKKIASLFILILCAFSSLNATTKTINVGQSGNSFTPSSVSAFVGDTIKWVYVSGFHTTTSTTIPVGADAWDAPMQSAGQTFIYKITVPGTYNYECTPHAPSMAGTIIATISNVNPISTVAEQFSLSQNYPNPFNPVTKINFSLPKADFVKLKVYDVLGNEVAELVNKNMTSGVYSVDFDANLNGASLSSGVYFYRLSTSEFTEVKKMYLVK